MAAPSSARPTDAPSAITAAVHVRVSRRAASACAARTRSRVAGEHPRGGVRQTQGARPVAALEERLLLGDDAPVLLERGACLAAVQLLPLALRILGKALQVPGDLIRHLRPRHRVAPVAQHERACLEPQEWLNRISSRRGKAQRGDRAGRDLSVYGHETAHRTETQGTDAREHDDHERRGEEDLGTEPHAREVAGLA